MANPSGCGVGIDAARAEAAAVAGEVTQRFPRTPRGALLQLPAGGRRQASDGRPAQRGSSILEVWWWEGK